MDPHHPTMSPLSPHIVLIKTKHQQLNFSFYYIYMYLFISLTENYLHILFSLFLAIYSSWLPIPTMMSYLSHANLTMVTSSWKIVDFMSGKVQSCLGIRGEHSRQNWPIVTTKLKLKSVVLVYVFLLVSAICFRFIRSIQSCCILLHLISHFDSAFWKCNQLWHSAASLCICHIL